MRLALRLAEARDRFCAMRRRPLHLVDFHRRWFRELAAYYRHLSREEFWLRYHTARLEAERIARESPERLWTDTDYFILRQMYYHRDRCFHFASALLPRGGIWLEYGCGVAPVTAWLRRHRRDAIGLASDVPSRTFTFAEWRWPRSILPIAYPMRYAAHLVICSEVLEHVANPVAVVNLINTLLLPGGHLLVNFVETDPAGANLEAAQAARQATIALLTQSLETIRPMSAHGPDGIYRKP